MAAKSRSATDSALYNSLALGGVGVGGVLTIVGCGLQWSETDVIAGDFDEKSINFLTFGGLFSWLCAGVSAVMYLREVEALGGAFLLVATAVLGFVNLDYPSVARTNFYRLFLRDSGLAGSDETAVEKTYNGQILVYLGGWLAILSCVTLCHCKRARQDFQHRLGLGLASVAVAFAALGAIVLLNSDNVDLNIDSPGLVVFRERDSLYEATYKIVEVSLFPVFVLAFAIYFDCFHLVVLAAFNLGSGFVFVMSDVFRAQSLRESLNFSAADGSRALQSGGFLCWISILFAFAAAGVYFEKKSDILP